MAHEFQMVQEGDFTTFTPGQKPVYAEIEEVLINIGGGGISGNQFKKEVLELAGWKYGKLISYGAHPDIAVLAFNRLRDVLAVCDRKKDIIQQLN